MKNILLKKTLLDGEFMHHEISTVFLIEMIMPIQLISDHVEIYIMSCKHHTIYMHEMASNPLATSGASYLFIVQKNMFLPFYVG